MMQDRWEGTAPELALIRGEVCVQWVQLGEGLCGEYDPEDDDDVELLRIDVYKRDPNTKEWELYPDGTFCTLMPVTATTEELRKALSYVMDQVYDLVVTGESIKREAESLSWIGQRDLHPKIDHIV